MSLRAVGQLLVASIGPILIVGIGLSLLELAAFAIRNISFVTNLPIVSSLDTTRNDAVSTFVGTGVAVAATLLGLYYATVGVVASTIYKDVSGEVRDLFVRERTGEIYIRSLVLTVVGGLAILVARAFGYNVSWLSLLAMAVLAALTSVWLMVLGQRLFGFFDPSLLTRSLSGRILRAIEVASDPASRDSSVRQRWAHLEVHISLGIYEKIVELLEGSSLRDARAPLSVTKQLLGVLGMYSARKDAISTESEWWGRVPQHQNWLTVEATKLEMAISTSSGFAPKRTPDYLWLETRIASLLEKTLSAAIRSKGGANVLTTADSVAGLVSTLASRLQIKEALAVEAAWVDAVAQISDSREPVELGENGRDGTLLQMAAAERLVHPLTSMWLGLVQAATKIENRHLPDEFELAISNPSALYNGLLPPQTRRILEQFSSAILREKRIEGSRKTPSWWINHYAARGIAEALLETEASIHSTARNRTFERLTHFREAGREDLVAVVGMASLELLHKIEVHLHTVRNVETKLRGFRSLSTSNEQWPQRIPGPDSPANDRNRLLTHLADSLPSLRRSQFDSREPDLYGQVYQFVFNGAFDAILSSSVEAADTLYRAAFLEMEPARQRLMLDLEHHEATARGMYSVEPFIGAMELAGYSLLLHELNGTGIWPSVKRSWDALLETDPQMIYFLLVSVEATDSVMVLTSGGVERSRRSIALNRLFESQGIKKPEWTGFDNNPVRSHSSAIVSAFAEDGFGIHSDLHHLFAAEYLSNHLPKDTDIGQRTQSLMKRISGYRNEDGQKPPQTSGGPDASK